MRERDGGGREGGREGGRVFELWENEETCKVSEGRERLTISSQVTHSLFGVLGVLHLQPMG